MWTTCPCVRVVGAAHFPAGEECIVILADIDCRNSPPWFQMLTSTIFYLCNLKLGNGRVSTPVEVIVCEGKLRPHAHMTSLFSSQSSCPLLFLIVRPAVACSLAALRKGEQTKVYYASAKFVSGALS